MERLAVDDPYGLERFIEAQRPVFREVVAELEAGRIRAEMPQVRFAKVIVLCGADARKRPGGLPGLAT